MRKLGTWSAIFHRRQLLLWSLPPLELAAAHLHGPCRCACCWQSDHMRLSFIKLLWVGSAQVACTVQALCGLKCPKAWHTAMSQLGPLSPM